MRITVARVLVVLAAVLAVVSLLASFVRFQALDTDTVSGTARSMIADEAIRDEVAASLVEELYANVDVQAELEARLPEAQQGLAGPAAAGLREVSDRVAKRMLERPRVQELWVATVTRAHAQLIDVLEDEGEVFRTSGGVVVLDLQPLVVQLGERVAVVGSVAERFGPDAGRIEILESDQLETAQDLAALLDFLGLWLWVLPVGLAVAAVWLAEGRRLPILRWIAVGSILAGLLVLVVRRLAGSYVVEDLVASPTVRPAAQNAWDILTWPLRDGGTTLVVLGLLVLLASWLGGRSSSAVGARRALAPYVVRRGIAYGVVGALFLLLLWWQPVVQLTRGPLILASAALLVLGVELLRRQTVAEVPSPPPADPLGSIRAARARRRDRRSAGDVDQLERLARLHREGALTDEEYAAQKGALLGPGTG